MYALTSQNTNIWIEHLVQHILVLNINIVSPDILSTLANYIKFYTIFHDKKKQLKLELVLQCYFEIVKLTMLET